MAYSELIKNFKKIREYVRQFYVYGFRSRNSYNDKSARSYDDEHRRLESWLGEYMRFRRESGGKIVFLSIDSRVCDSNPLYVAFKAKSFTANDIVFHFYLMDALCGGKEMTVQQLLEWFDSEYLSVFEYSMEFDESNVRKKLKEYIQLGLIKAKKESKKMLYSRNDSPINTASWLDAVTYFSECDPLGVIGSYILERHSGCIRNFRFKHHYIFRALDSEIIYKIASAIQTNRFVKLDLRLKQSGYLSDDTVFPIRICVSTQTGRQHLLGYHKQTERIVMIRIDNIADISLKNSVEDPSPYIAAYRDFSRYQWGVSVNDSRITEHIEMTVRVCENEGYIINRLKREKRCGEIKRIDASHYRFSADVYDATELLPWIRTFIGRITDFKCSNTALEERFLNDIRQMYKMYWEEDDDIS